MTSEPENVAGTLRPVRDAAVSLATTLGRAILHSGNSVNLAAAVPVAHTQILLARQRASELVDRIDEAAAWLAELEETLRDPRRFDPGRWPERQRAISEQLRAKPLDGARSLLGAWARAFLVGCPDEAERLAAGPFELPAEAAWLPDRIRTAPDALQARSVARLAPLLDYLADGAPLAGQDSVPADVCAQAAVLHARLLLPTDPDGAARLLDRARQLAGRDDAEVLAARAALTRTQISNGSVESAPAEDAVALARQAWQEERCAGAAVELFLAEHGGNVQAAARGGPSPAAAASPAVRLAAARRLLAELPFAAARLDSIFDVLIQPVPDEMWAAAADLAADDHEYEAAARLADRVKPDANSLLLVELADLRVRIAEETGRDDLAVAGLLDAAGTAALVAEQPQRAIASYQKALAKGGDDHDAGIHLADALLNDGWGKPLAQIEPQLQRALQLVARYRDRHPLDAATSWSLLTESYLHTQLAQTAAPDTRAAELWLAALVAARAVAFDPAEGRCWARLADAMTSLKCRRTALVLSEHARRLNSDDPPVRDAYLTALGNMALVELALSILDQGGQQTSGPWYCGVRALLLRMSADEHEDEGDAVNRTKDALKAADEAVRGQPDGLWFHQVRAGLLLDLESRDQALEEFDYMWREARLGEADGLEAAAWAAIELGLGRAAVSLGEQVVELAEATVAECEEYAIRGTARVLQSAPGGVADLLTAVNLAVSRFEISNLRRRLDRQAGNITVDLSEVMARIAEREAKIEADYTRPELTFVGPELDRVAVNRRYAPAVARQAALTADLTRAFTRIAGSDPDGLTDLRELAGQHSEYPELSTAAATLEVTPAPDGGQPSPAPAASQPEAEISLPPSWFAGLADPLDHDIIKRYIPDARARLQRTVGKTLPGVNFRDDASLEPGGYRITLHGAVIDEGQVNLERCYVPAELAPALDEHVRAQVVPAPDVAELDCIPVPSRPDSLTSLVTWPAPEAVARFLERAFTLDWLVAQGRGAEAVAECRTLLAAREQRLGPDDPATLAIRYTLAGLLFAEKQPDAAEREYRTLVDAYTRVKGADDPTTLLFRQQLVNLLASADKLDEAEAGQRAILAACVQLYGEDNETTLAVRYSLAGVFYRQRRLADAEAEYRAVLDRQTRVVGADHADTLMTREQFASVLAAQDRHAEAVTEYRAVLDARERTLGRDDQATLNVRQELAQTLERLERFAEAEAEYRAILEVRERLNGSDDQGAIVARYNVARMLQQEHRPVEAETEYRTALDAETRVKGADDPDTLVIQRYLATLLAEQNRLDEAEGQYQAIRDARQRTLGSDDADTLTARQELAGVLERLERFAEAEAEYRAILEVRERLNGSDDQGAIVARYNVARMLQQEHRPVEAETEYRTALDAETRVKGADDPDTLVIQRYLATLLAEQNRLDEAEAQYQAVLDARERILGSDDASTLAVRQDLTGILVRQGRPAEAEAQYRLQLEARERLDDEQGAVVARYSVALMLQQQGRLAEAEAEYRTVLDTETRDKGPDDQETLIVRRQLAILLAAVQGRTAEAEAEYRAVLDSYGRRGDSDTPTTASIRFDLAELLNRSGRPADAETEYRAALGTFVHVNGAEHPETVRFRRRIAAVAADQGRQNEAEAELRDLLTAAPVRGDDLNTALVTFDLAGLLRKQGRLADAKVCYRTALGIQTRLKGSDDPDTMMIQRELDAVIAGQNPPAASPEPA